MYYPPQCHYQMILQDLRNSKWVEAIRSFSLLSKDGLMVLQVPNLTEQVIL